LHKNEHNHEPVERRVSRLPTEAERNAVDEVVARLSPQQALAELKRRAKSNADGAFVPTLEYLKGRRRVVQQQELPDMKRIAECGPVFDFFLRRAGQPGMQIVLLRKDAVAKITAKNPNSNICFVDGTWKIFQ
jgi:hypothetical protein